ncbi:MAG: polyprenyl synthetase family protein [bacterium]|nr:polyprenyl synthetase family protein [bacterium]
MILKQAFEVLGPILKLRYENVLRGLLGESGGLLNDLHSLYLEYAVRDVYMPRPILTFFGYHYGKDDISFERVDEIGDIILIAQLVRDIAAIHDDIIDEDVLKFGKPPLPVLFSAPVFNEEAYQGKRLTKRGKDLAVLYGDYLYGVLGQLILSASRLHGSMIVQSLGELVADVFRVTNQGQIHELLMDGRSIEHIAASEILELYRAKAAYYCYAFPFEVGLIIAGANCTVRTKSKLLLLDIGVASQIVDDIAGAFPDLLDQGKDTKGELQQLRRTMLIVLFAKTEEGKAFLPTIADRFSLSEEEIRALKKAMIESACMKQAIGQAQSVLGNYGERIEEIGLGICAKRYLMDLIQVRVRGNLEQIERKIQL